jgi:transcriptional regulator with XRE-family HTH domain
MDRPGEKLKHARERLNLTYREVEAASQRIAERRGSDEFAIALSRLADIENKGTVPTIFRLYTLCALYRLDFHEVLAWYGVPLDQLVPDAFRTGLQETHALHFRHEGPVTVPLPAELEIDLERTNFLSHLIRGWGKLPLALLGAFDFRKHQYGFIGLGDRSMVPLLQPGSLVVIDASQHRIAAGGWTNEFDRPIYFVEHRGGYACGWCTAIDSHLVLQPHPASQQRPHLFDMASIDVLGQVIGVAMILESGKGRRRTSAAPPASPGP